MYWLTFGKVLCVNELWLKEYLKALFETGVCALASSDKYWVNKYKINVIHGTLQWRQDVYAYIGWKPGNKSGISLHLLGRLGVNIHYSDVIMSVMASQITSLTIVYCLSRSGSTKTSKLRITGLCEGYSPVTSEFAAQRASKAKNLSIWWRHHVDGHYDIGFTWEQWVNGPK